MHQSVWTNPIASTPEGTVTISGSGGVRPNRLALWAGCAVCAIALNQASPALAGADGVIFGAGAATDNATATGTASLAASSSDGTAASATGTSSIAVGDGASASGTNGIALGASATGAGAGAIAIGGLANSQGTIAIGTGSTGTSQATATGSNAIAIGSGFPGFQTIANGSFAVALGAQSQATGQQSMALGGGARATQFDSLAVGIVASASGIEASAFGGQSSASGLASTALGFGATASGDNSTAIGTGATATRANQVAVGTATNTYTLAGLTSAASLAAQTGPVSFVTSDSGGNLATISSASIASAASVAALDGRVTNLETNVRTLNYDVRKAFEGAAVAIAMGGAALPDNKKFAISANWGNFSGENAFGGMAQMRISNNFVANAAIGAGFARGGVGGRIGGTFAW